MQPQHDICGEAPMLSSFTIEKFKSYRDATLKLAPLTATIGANASGKSNAIEALRLLSRVAAGDRLGSIRHALQEDRQIRGNVSDLPCRGARAFSLSCLNRARHVLRFAKQITHWGSLAWAPWQAADIRLYVLVGFVAEAADRNRARNCSACLPVSGPLS